MGDINVVNSTKHSAAYFKVSDGKSVKVNVPANSGDITAGNFYEFDGFLGIAMQNLANSATDAQELILNIEQAEYESDQIDATKAFNKGDRVYWDANNKRFTTGATVKFAGVVTSEKDANNVIWFILWPGVIDDTSLAVIGNLASLTTTDKATLIAGVNEVKGLADTALAAAQGAPAFTIGDEAEDVINVAVQLKDIAGAEAKGATLCQVWLSDAAGGAPCAVAPSGTVVAGDAGVIIASLTAKTHLLVATDADGKFNLDITEAGAKDLYVNVEVQGRIYSSEKVTFAA